MTRSSVPDPSGDVQRAAGAGVVGVVYPEVWGGTAGGQGYGGVPRDSREVYREVYRVDKGAGG